MGTVALHGLEDREQARQASAAHGSDGAVFCLLLNLGGRLEVMRVLAGGRTGTCGGFGLTGSVGRHSLVCFGLWIHRELSAPLRTLLLLVTWGRVHWCVLVWLVLAPARALGVHGVCSISIVATTAIP